MVAMRSFSLKRVMLALKGMKETMTLKVKVVKTSPVVQMMLVHCC